jgi:hypothetical protein
MLQAKSAKERCTMRRPPTQASLLVLLVSINVLEVVTHSEWLVKINMGRGFPARRLCPYG